MCSIVKKRPINKRQIIRVDSKCLFQRKTFRSPLGFCLVTLGERGPYKAEQGLCLPLKSVSFPRNLYRPEHLQRERRHLISFLLQGSICTLFFSAISSWKLCKFLLVIFPNFSVTHWKPSMLQPLSASAVSWTVSPGSSSPLSSSCNRINTLIH